MISLGDDASCQPPLLADLWQLLEDFAGQEACNLILVDAALTDDLDQSAGSNVDDGVLSRVLLVPAQLLQAFLDRAFVPARSLVLHRR